MSQPAAVETFDPSAYEVFRIVGLHVDEEDALVQLHYALDDELELTETLRFVDARWPLDPARREALRRLATLLLLLAGTSYFKLAAPPRIAVEVVDLSPRLRALLDDVYTLGLGEFGYRNGIDPRTRGALPEATVADGHALADAAATSDRPQPGVIAATMAHRLPSLTATGRTLVPIGGGKDSPVALELVRRAGHVPVAFSVGDAAPIVGEVAAAGVAHVVAERTLDPKLGALNAAGALNGHVPVTAVVSTIALMAAVLAGCDGVAMANERSASEANLDWDGLAVNHQWSKGVAFEHRLADLLAHEVVEGLAYRSVLRPAGELAIARAFAGLTDYHPVFTSCNRVFRLDPARRHGHWCGECDKCRFVVLALAPWLGPQELRAILGRDPLDEPEQLDGFLDLAGLREHKPFECVGEEAESLAAMRLVADRRDWADHAVVRALREGPLAELEALGGGSDGRGVDLDGPLRLDEAALAELPEDLRAAARELLG